MSFVLPNPGASAPYLSQYFGVWSICDDGFLGMVHLAQTLNLQVHLAERSAAGDGGRAGVPLYTVENGIARISINGTLMKQQTSMGSGTSTVLARRAVREAAADSKVSGILIEIDSPGGTVAGTEELASDVASAAKVKPVHAHISDLGASAAYWVASQASRITANATALVGSIGTYGVVQDMSGAAAMEGIKVHVLRAGEFKGSGVAGTEVTAPQLAEYQRVVDELNSHFTAAVAAGRNLTKAAVAGIADGRVHIAGDAKKLGLIDAVGGIDQALASLTKASRSNKQMATYQEIEAACPGAPESFCVKQLKADATPEIAAREWIAEQNRQIAERQAQIERLTAAASKPGIQPVAAGQGDEERSVCARDEFRAAVNDKVRSGMGRQAAVSAVVRERPELQTAVLAEANAGRRLAR